MSLRFQKLALLRLKTTLGSYCKKHIGGGNAGDIWL